MAADEAAPKEDAGAGDGSGVLSGKRGWIIVIGIVVLEAVFFSVLLTLKEEKKEAPTDIDKTGISNPSLDQYMHKEIPLKGLTYSIPTPGGTPMTLTMDISMVMAMTPREISDKVLITEEDWKKFEDAINKMKGKILDRLNGKIDKMSVNELQSNRGKEQIKEFVQEMVNSELGRIDLMLSDKKISTSRIQSVFLTNYYLQ